MPDTGGVSIHSIRILVLCKSDSQYWSHSASSNILSISNIFCSGVAYAITKDRERRKTMLILWLDFNGKHLSDLHVVCRVNTDLNALFFLAHLTYSLAYWSRLQVSCIL